MAFVLYFISPFGFDLKAFGDTYERMVALVCCFLHSTLLFLQLDESTAHAIHGIIFYCSPIPNS